MPLIMCRPFFELTASSDVYFNNVTLLMHMDGSNNGTLFSDQIGHTFSVTAPIVTSTAQAKFGTASMLSTGGFIKTPGSIDWDLSGGDFTVEFWYRPVQAPNTSLFVGTANPWFGSGDINGAAGWGLRGDTNALTFVGNGNVQGSVAITWDVNTWTHIAWTRSGSTYRYFKNGVLLGSHTTGTLPSDSTNSLFIGGNSDHAGTSAAQGYLDDLRITKGVARYTGAFTPPTQAFSNS